MIRETATSLTGVLEFITAFESLLLSGTWLSRRALSLSLSFRLSVSHKVSLTLTLSSEKKLIKAEIDLQSRSGGVRVQWRLQCPGELMLESVISASRSLARCVMVEGLWTVTATAQRNPSRMSEKGLSDRLPFNSQHNSTEESQTKVY